MVSWRTGRELGLPIFWKDQYIPTLSELQQKSRQQLRELHKTIATHTSPISTQQATDAKEIIQRASGFEDLIPEVVPLALDLEDYLLGNGHIRLWREMLTQLYTATMNYSEDDAVRMKLLARIATRLGIDASAYHLNPKEAASNFKSAIDFGLSHGDPGLWLPVAASYLHATGLDNPLNKTREEAESLLELGRRHNDLKSQLITYMALGLAYNHYGHYADAFVWGQQALAIALQVNDRRRAFISGLVMLEHAKRNPQLRPHARELILFLRRDSLLNHNLSYQGYYYTHVAAFFHEKKAFDVAIRYYKRALEIFVEVTKEPHSQAKTLLGLGLALTQNGKYDHAVEHLELALSLYEELQQPLYIGWVRYCIGWNDHKRGRSQKAQAYLEDTYQYLEDLPPSAGRNSLLRQLRQDLDEVRSHLKGTL